MRLLSGRAKETEIKLSEGFQSGPGADSDFGLDWGLGTGAGDEAQTGQTLIYFVACQMQLQPEQNKVSMPGRTEDRRPKDAEQRAKGSRHSQKPTGVARH